MQSISEPFSINKDTHAIEDRNVLRFHVDYYKPEGSAKIKNKPKPGEPLAKKAIVEAILEKHHAATNERKFNAVLATGSINDAIEYHALFKTQQVERQAAEGDFQPLNIACVFSPPAQMLAKDKDNQNEKNVADIKQLQDDLPQEKADNEQEPEKKKAALIAIIADYNTFGTEGSRLLRVISG